MLYYVKTTHSYCARPRGTTSAHCGWFYCCASCSMPLHPCTDKHTCVALNTSYICIRWVLLCVSHSSLLGSCWIPSAPALLVSRRAAPWVAAYLKLFHISLFIFAYVACYYCFFCSYVFLNFIFIAFPYILFAVYYSDFSWHSTPPSLALHCHFSACFFHLVSVISLHEILLPVAIFLIFYWLLYPTTQTLTASSFRCFLNCLPFCHLLYIIFAFVYQSSITFLATLLRLHPIYAI